MIKQNRPFPHKIDIMSEKRFFKNKKIFLHIITKYRLFTRKIDAKGAMSGKRFF